MQEGYIEMRQESPEYYKERNQMMADLEKSCAEVLEKTNPQVKGLDKATA